MGAAIVADSSGPVRGFVVFPALSLSTRIRPPRRRGNLPAMRLRALLLLALVCASCGARERPDVVLVTLDTTRADRLSCYGYGKETTPRLDELAAEGARFTQAVSQAAVTPVAHASILTGLLPYNHGLRVMHGAVENALAPEALTLAEILQADGYATGAFVSAFPVTESFGFGQGFDRFDASFLPNKTERLVRDGVVNTGKAQREAGETVDLALEWWRATEGPRFLWLHFFDPHDPKVLPPDDYMQSQGELPEEERDWLRAVYDIELTYMDRELGRVWDELRAGERWDQTVVCVTADHGEGLGDHDWWTHGVLYQEQIRVPLVVRGPGIPSGVVLDDMVRTMDLMPTVLDLAAVPSKLQPPMDGVSLAPLANGESVDIPFAYAESVNCLTYAFSPTIKDKKEEVLFTLHDGRWKYTHYMTSQGEGELYDLEADPGELENLYDQEREVVDRLHEELKARPFLPAKQLESVGASPERIELLRALGYTGD